MSTSEETPLWQRIRDAVSSNRLFKFNIAYHDVDREDYAERLFEDSVVTISDWALATKGGVELAPDGSVLSPETVHEPFGNTLKGQIQWDVLRDIMHEKIYSDEETKIKAGKSIGSIRTFVESVDPGDVLLVNLPSGIAPCVVASSTVYDRSTEYSDIAPNHIMYREVKWASDGEGPLTVSADLLPPKFGTARHTIEQVSDPSPMVELLRVVEWVGDSIGEKEQ